MPNHWHLVVWPSTHDDLPRFMHWLTTTHAQRWHAAHGTSGTGPVYQGRYKAIPVQSDQHLFTACRYVERNPVRAGLVNRAEHWRWSSIWRRCNSCDDEFLQKWPIPIPDNWLELVNAVQNECELNALRDIVRHGLPLGDPAWRERTGSALGLPTEMRRPGRPRITA